MKFKEILMVIIGILSLIIFYKIINGSLIEGVEDVKGKTTRNKECNGIKLFFNNPANDLPLNEYNMCKRVSKNNNNLVCWDDGEKVCSAVKPDEDNSCEKKTKGQITCNMDDIPNPNPPAPAPTPTPPTPPTPPAPPTPPTPPPGGACSSGVDCKSGEFCTSCDPWNPDCNDYDDDNFDVFIGKNAKCIQKLDRGEICRSEERRINGKRSCKDGLVCAGDTGDDSDDEDTHYTCQLPVEEGEHCINDEVCKGYYYPNDENNKAFCLDGTCRKKCIDDPYCDSNRECINLEDYDNVCLPEGEICKFLKKQQTELIKQQADLNKKITEECPTPP